ncbi:UNVERIFIED_CONTAM: hypothetical protein HDU68_002972 [Siphonaria sp. JEL0065]|nr:hypothetical protein HDU68_002972 [Siphonaria sp. JEL0065]
MDHIKLPPNTKHTALLFFHDSLECIATSSSGYQLVRSSGPIPAGSVLLVEHVVHGDERQLVKVLEADTDFANLLDPRDAPLDRISKIKRNAFVGYDGSMRLGPVVTRFNHRCDPDASVRYVYEETECKHRPGHFRKDGFAVIYALRDIEPSKEVCYQYNAYAHSLFGCDCGRTDNQLQNILERNRDVVGPPMVEQNRKFLEELIAAFLDKREATCAYCGKSVQNLCKGCETVSYCGAICQRADWPLHKVICRAS